MSNKKIIILFISFVSCAIIFRYYNDKRKEKLLVNTSQTIAIYRETEIIYNTGRVSYFDYKVDKKYVLEVYSMEYSLEQGDTVMIEYSLEDPSVARVIDFKYSQRNKPPLDN